MTKKTDGKPFTKQDECLQELGRALIWMNYIHPELFKLPGSRKGMEEQKARVEVLIKEYIAANHQYEPTSGFWPDFLERITDEIDNMS